MPVAFRFVIACCILGYDFGDHLHVVARLSLTRLNLLRRVLMRLCR